MTKTTMSVCIWNEAEQYCSKIYTSSVMRAWLCINLLEIRDAFKRRQVAPHALTLEV